MAQAANQIASQGRYGDSIIAHLTPGEVQVPPEILQANPQLLAALKAAFQKMGVDISQFTAGSPATTKNPFTGVEENSIWGALMPVLGAVLGTMLLPGVGTGLGLEAGAAGGALGGAAGGLAGGLIDHTGPAGALLGALGGGLGGFAGGGGLHDLFAGSSAATGVAGSAGAAAASGASSAEMPDAGIMAADNPSIGAGAATTAGAGSAGTAAAKAPSFLQALKGPGLWAGGGATLASFLSPTPSSSSTSAPDTDINKTYPPPTINPNWGQVIGSNASPTPTFAGFNPFTSVTQPGGFTFYPVQA
jgi:hypothetical protein